MIEAVTDPRLPTSQSSSFQLAATPIVSQNMQAAYHGTPHFVEPSSKQQARPDDHQAPPKQHHQKELYMATEDYRDPSKISLAESKKNQTIPSRMTVDEHSREIVV